MLQEVPVISIEQFMNNQLLRDIIGPLNFNEAPHPPLGQRVTQAASRGTSSGPPPESSRSVKKRLYAESQHRLECVEEREAGHESSPDYETPYLLTRASKRGGARLSMETATRDNSNPQIRQTTMSLKTPHQRTEPFLPGQPLDRHLERQLLMRSPARLKPQDGCSHKDRFQQGELKGERYS